MLWQEFTGSTTDTWPYVYISDGGHFENLGLYELVKRRVKFIVASDASCDPNLVCADLGVAIERCRADFNYEVTINLSGIRRQSMRFAIGTIDYGETEPGILVYVKPMVLGEAEPADVIAYASVHKNFPHDSTANQWFMESQFEAYRVLGAMTFREVLMTLRDTSALRAMGVPDELILRVSSVIARV